MLWIVVEGVKPWDGRYPFDFGADFTTQEWGWIKRLAGYMPMNVSDGFEGGDPELFAVFAVIALRRSGKIEPRQVPEVFERIGEAPFGTTIRVENDPADDEAGDADGPPPSSSNGNERTSGPGSRKSSETSAGPPNGSGIPDSDTSAWDLSTLGT